MDTRPLSEIPCCTCGVPIEPNARGQCFACIRTEVDITAGISRSVALDRCSVCGAYHRNPQWIMVEPESAELLALCLKRTRGLDGSADGAHRLKLVDASFIWTESHSKRLRVKVTVRAELEGGLELEQQAVVEYVLRGGQCRACERLASKQLWKACVQLRQKAPNARVLHYLEQVVLQGGVATGASEIKPVKGGIDFFFLSRHPAEKLVAYLGTYAMTRVKASKTLITHNEKAGTANIRLTWAVEVAPICKDDLVLLPRGTAAGLGLPSPLCVVAKTGTRMLLVHPQSARSACLSETAFWKAPFRPILSRRSAKQFAVLDVELDAHERGGTSSQCPSAPASLASGSARGSGGGGGMSSAGGGAGASSRFARADAQVVRGESYEHVLSVFTHLGRVLSAGDTALGYDVAASSALDDLASELPPGVHIPDVVLIGKVHAGARKHRKRNGTHTRARYGGSRASGSELGTDASSALSGSEPDEAGAAELDALLDELELRADAGEALEPGAELAALQLTAGLSVAEEGEGEGAEPGEEAGGEEGGEGGAPGSA